MGTKDRNKSSQQSDQTSIVVKRVEDSDIPNLEKWVNYWDRLGVENNSSIEKIKIGNLDLCLITYVNNEVAAISGVDYIKENIWRVLVRAATTIHRPKQFSKRWYEDNLYPWRGHAGFECAYIREYFNNEAKFITSTNVNEQSTRTILRWRAGFRAIDREKGKIENLYGVDQYLWPVNADACIEMGKEFFPNWNEIYDSL